MYVCMSSINQSSSCCILNLALLRSAAGDTLLHKVCEYWDEVEEDWETLEHFFEVFITNKADLDVQNNRGETPIMIAIKRGQIMLTAHLFRNGVDLSICDYDGNSVLHKAVKSLHLHNFYAVGNWHDFLIRSKSSCRNYDPYKKNNQHLTALQLAEKMKEDMKIKFSYKERSSKEAECDLSTVEDMIIYLKTHVSQL